MSNVCYFEIPVEDMNRSQQFYRDLFQWQFEKLPGTPPEVDYHNILTGTPDEPGVAFGGLMRKQKPTHSITPYVSVDMIEQSMQRVEQLGGQVLMAKTPVPGRGYFAICLDPDKNLFGLWQCDESAQS